MESRSWTLKRTFNDGPDSLGCAVGCALLAFGGVLFLVVLYMLWTRATSGV
jgi:hypothetical protein